MDILRRSLLSLGLTALLAGSALSGPASAEPQSTITVASTTSTEQSGLFKHLLPTFTEKTGIGVKVVALGTGQALDVGRRGDADVVFVHDKAAEEKFVAEGFGTKRHAVMYNDFVVIGPKADPAGAKGSDVTAAFARIAAAKAPFVSRGDRSGTHAAELRYWKDAGIDPVAAKGGWYKDVGQGMGPALNTASAANAYILADRGTWLSFKNRGDLAILVQGDKRLFNQYGVMLVNPEKHPQVKAKEGQAFIDWLVSPEGQRTIADYKIEGEQLFFPNAEPGKS
ncbi:substrate-binding domain-containing protein [Methylobacterium oxalidis]|uniref:Tungsten ABC transporter substrate-binding protein n=1 Tax=Methylobacterium oxalidis TaxID=944322 RepID=A0A512J772_9HYPH|nr:substrate-binding domain-containing protein [Methylobacterium oxalidis]GEP05770.1 tungsten ABC transporter substrate-binding protein [Methylobacterium oxalidis]GJE33285.1 Tungstate-binding protein TupA [Methylobacterium oxalidis]GLS62647.1 tungsten ABC transporter substrate-binding protein [Methylobacterium oxalidis]